MPEIKYFAANYNISLVTSDKFSDKCIVSWICVIMIAIIDSLMFFYKSNYNDNST